MTVILTLFIYCDVIFSQWLGGLLCVQSGNKWFEMRLWYHFGASKLDISQLSCANKIHFTNHYFLGVHTPLQNSPQWRTGSFVDEPGGGRWPRANDRIPLPTACGIVSFCAVPSINSPSFYITKYGLLHNSTIQGCIHYRLTVIIQTDSTADQLHKIGYSCPSCA